ncbi:MAG: ribosome biogenesis GTP-binding protein YihA/YsxC [Lautropia sp.]|nr:ribosome biogenesis GTP-binding protein YihA/YsxC [Lautropia sp.]
MSLLLTARFADTVAQLPQLDRANPEGLPEVAFVGRSNAGKSSCINTVCNQKRLAFSSRTPGRTQALNLFAVGPVNQPRPTGFLVDTPGYGFATASPQAKQSWQRLAGDYITRRQALAGVVLMVDIRRGLTDLDRQLLAWTPAVLPLVLVLTKADKLSRQQAVKVRDQIAREPVLREREGPVLLQLFSILNRHGVEALRAAIGHLLQDGPWHWQALVAARGPAMPLLLKGQGLMPDAQAQAQVQMQAQTATEAPSGPDDEVAAEQGPAHPDHRG